jgi:hypothetical protein
MTTASSSSLSRCSPSCELYKHDIDSGLQLEFAGRGRGLLPGLYRGGSNESQQPRPTDKPEFPPRIRPGGCCDEFARGLGRRLPVNFGVAGSLSPYDVIIYLFCTELLLYSKDVTFVYVPLFIICVRHGPSTLGDYVRARVLDP